MDAIKNLLSSAHGLFGVLLVIGAVALVALGKMSTEQWTAFSEWIFTTFVGGHAAVSLSDAISSKKADKP